MARRRSRPSWEELPGTLRSQVAGTLGSPVVGTTSMPGGWSPGSADRLVLADGRRAFVKAASAEVKAVTVALHRREAAVLGALTGSGLAPDLLGVVEDGPWLAVLVEDVGGRHPDPGDPDDTRAVLDAVAALPDPIPAGVPEAEGDMRAALEDGAAGWTRLLADGAAGTVPGGEHAVRRLAELSAAVGPAVDGTALTHLDLRVDNAVIDGAGRARLVDWPNASPGVRWFDGVTYLLDVRRLAPSAGPLLPPHPLFDGVPPESIDSAAAALAGYFYDGARRPAPPGLDGLRAFQREQGLVLLEALAERAQGV